MSYDIYLKDESGNPLALPPECPQAIGGTFAVGGRMAELNVTYNYSRVLYRLFPDNGIRSLYGKTGKETISLLDKAISELGNDTCEDYWQATEGNVKVALQGLLSMATHLPEGIWAGD